MNKLVFGGSISSRGKSSARLRQSSGLLSMFFARRAICISVSDFNFSKYASAMSVRGFTGRLGIGGVSTVADADADVDTEGVLRCKLPFSSQESYVFVVVGSDSEVMPLCSLRRMERSL